VRLFFILSASAIRLIEWRRGLLPKDGASASSSLTRDRGIRICDLP
jgi:hypothetical protein